MTDHNTVNNRRWTAPAVAFALVSAAAAGMLAGGAAPAAAATWSNPLPGLVLPAECTTSTTSSLLVATGSVTKHRQNGAVKVRLAHRHGKWVAKTHRTVKLTLTAKWSGTATFNSCLATGGPTRVYDPYSASVKAAKGSATVTVTAASQAIKRGKAAARRQAMHRLTKHERSATTAGWTKAVAKSKHNASTAAFATAAKGANNGGSYALPTAAQVRAAIIRDTNLVRAAAGVGSVRSVDAASQWGQAWAQHLAATNSGPSHSGPATPTSAGYPAALWDCETGNQTPRGNLSFGENVAEVGLPPAADGDPSKTLLHPSAAAELVAAEATRAWMSDAGHYDQMVTAGWDRLGVGAAAANPNAILTPWYVDQEFTNDHYGTCSELP